ncbi:MAG: hypothetical protein F4X02_00135 [Chloroflexi bacterium]|nr:hypothetical protein [Chloroflexota bacterium]
MPPGHPRGKRARMSIQRKTLLSPAVLIAVVAALFTGSAPALAAECTLADHIRSANTNTAVGGCPAGTSHDVITFTEDITLSMPLPPITGTITIEGGGHTISGDNEVPIFVVAGGRLTINNLTLSEGYARDSSSAPAHAGALRAHSGAVIVVNRSVFKGNRSDQFGGAISIQSSRLTVNGSSFLRNRARVFGGAISVNDGQWAVKNSSFIHNRAEDGGAIFLGLGNGDVRNSSFIANSADRGGAVATTDWSLAASLVSSSTTLTHVTIVKNYARKAGSGIAIHGDYVNFQMRNSIVAGKPLRADSPARMCAGPLKENLGNFIEDGSCGSRAGGDPMLAEMTGSPAYFAQLDGSPTLDAADARFCLETDQLGTPRPQGEGCDIGAIESTTARSAAPPVLPPPPCPLADQIAAANTDAPAGGCPAGSGHDVIRLSANIKLDAPLPPITSEITIEGNGYTISGADKFRIFDVDGGALTISQATLTQGKASRGGAILLRHGGRALAADVTFIRNSAFFGGAIATESDGDRLTVSASSFIGNTAETRGGAVFMDGGNVKVSANAFVDNRAQEYGGAVAIARGRAAISNSTFSGSAATRGGGIYASGGETTLTHITVMNSSAGRVVGAGIYADGGAVFLRNILVAGSGGGDDCSGRFAETRGNFSQEGDCAAKIGGDPELGDLVGSPAHYPLLDGSPAHGAADPAFCLPADQLGNPRTHCDIGAIESARDPNYAAAPDADLPADCALADQIIAANTDAPSGACPAGDGADVIHLRRDITLREPLPAINSDVTLDGHGHTISGGNRFRIFDIESGEVTIKHTTLANGSSPEGYGGAIRLRNRASVKVFNVTFRDNRARIGGAISAVDESYLRVFDSYFYDNAAVAKGGAIWGRGKCAFSDDGVFRRNQAGSPTMTRYGTYETKHYDVTSDICTGIWGNQFFDA